MQSSIDALTQRPRRRVRKRLIAAVLASVGLHVLLFSKFPEIPKERRYVTLKATLNEQNAQGHDREDSDGTSTDIMQAQAPSTPSVPPSPSAPPIPPVIPLTEPLPPAQLPPPLPPMLTAEHAATPLPPPAPVRPPVPPTPPTPKASAKPADRPTPVQPPAPTVSKPADSVAAPPKRELAGDTDVFGTPEEIEYHRILTAHLRARTPPYPPGLHGAIRLQVKIQYGSVITSVEVISNSGGDALEQWARTVILGISPVPGVPKGVKQPYFFRPTIEIGD